MRVEWALMAEAVTQDARGALAVVGLSQSVVHAPALPVMVKRAIVLLISGEKQEFTSGQPVRFSIRVTAPSGEVVCSHDANIPTAPIAPGNLPAAINLAAEIVFLVKEYGRHSITITAQLADRPQLSADLNFYPMPPPENNPHAGAAASDTQLTGVSEDQ